MSPFTASTLNARDRKLPKNSRGEVVAKDAKRKGDKLKKRKHSFFISISSLVKLNRIRPYVAKAILNGRESL
jgi:hypothetical protein